MAYDKVLSADGEELQRRKARATSRKYKSFSTEMQSLLGVPFLWVVHLWYFWPEIRKPNGDPYIKRNTVRSMTAFTAVAVALLGWLFAYHIGGQSLLGDTYEDLNISNLDLDTLLQQSA